MNYNVSEIRDLIAVNYETEQPTASARNLHEQLHIETPFKKWIDRMCEYGFEEYIDFWTKMSESTGGRPSTEYEISIDMAKQICMIQRSPEGKQIRQYFLDLEKAWNTPEQIFARALKMADKTIDKLKSDNAILIEDNERMKPKEIFADAVSTSDTSILIGELAKILRQNGVQTGQNKLFEWMRCNGYLIKRKGSDWNMPTQRAMDMDLFEIKETVINQPNGSTKISKTTKVTGKGQQYFINKLLAAM